MARWRPLVGHWTFNFQPAEGDAGLAIFFRERILPASRAGPRTEQPACIWPNHFACEQPCVQLMDAWLGGHIEIAQFSQ